jgi:hypothetical protein
LRAKRPMLSPSARPIEKRFGRGNATSMLIQPPS